MNLLNAFLYFFMPSPTTPVKVVDNVDIPLNTPAPPTAAKVDIDNLDFRECITSWAYIKETYPFIEEDISHKIDLKLAEEWREALAAEKSVIAHVCIWPTKGATYSLEYVYMNLFNNDLDSYFRNYIGDRDVAAYSHKHILHWLNEPHDLSTSSAPFDILSREDFFAQKLKQALDAKPAGAAAHGKDNPPLTR